MNDLSTFHYELSPDPQGKPRILGTSPQHVKKAKPGEGQYMKVTRAYIALDVTAHKLRHKEDGDYLRRIVASLNYGQGLSTNYLIEDYDNMLKNGERPVVEALEQIEPMAASLMDELGGRKAADWGLINGTLVSVAKLVRKLRGQP